MEEESSVLPYEGSVTDRQDLLRRFTSTPHTVDLRLMQRTVRLETNSEHLLAFARNFFERHQHGEAVQREFLWRIVCESDSHVQSADPQLFAFSDFGLRYVNVGQRGFLATDLEKREAAGFLADLFFEDATGLRNNRALDLLFCMTAPSLGLTALSGGCVSVKDRGALVFGPPNSGKTTACYLAAQAGMEFHADQMIFLDMRGGTLRAWGDFFPAVFRPETLDFLSELRQLTRASSHAGMPFYYFDKSPLQERWARPVNPTCSLFLERSTVQKPQLKEMNKEDAVSRLQECMLFNEDEQFEPQITSALNMLASLPIYSLQYGPDPRIAAAFIEMLLR